MLGFIQNITGAALGLISPLSTVGNDVVAAVANKGYGVILDLFRKLPDGGGLPQGVHDGAIYFGNALGKINFMVPTDILVSCLVLILTLKITLWGFHIGVWIYNSLRGIATGRYDGRMV